MNPPIQPTASDCCSSGCNPCILDIYEDQLRVYNKLKDLQISSLKNCINPTSYTTFKIARIEEHAEDAFIYVFEYVLCTEDIEKSMEEMCVQYKPGQYFMLKCEVENEVFCRAYTPIPFENISKLQFAILVKFYLNGKCSNYLKLLRPESNTFWRGPYGKFDINYDEKSILFIAQGTGIAPIFAILHNMIDNEDCFTFLKLYYCCKNPSTIYLREQLYSLLANWNFTYEIFLGDSNGIVEKYNEIVNNMKLNVDIIKAYLCDKIDSVKVVICGSESFMDCVEKYVLECDVNKELIRLL